MVGHKIFLRKLQEAGNPRYYQVHYDFKTKDPGRRVFYKMAPGILKDKIRNCTLTQSVIGIFDKQIAEDIFNLAKDCNAESVVLCEARTLDQFPRPKD